MSSLSAKKTEEYRTQTRAAPKCFWSKNTDYGILGAMNAHTALAAGIAFIAAGLLFCAAALYLKSRKAAETSPVSGVAGTIFYLIGALTGVTGMLAVLFRNEAPALAIKAGFLVYLVLLTIILVVFINMLKAGTKQ